ncbi:box C/D snoRNA protein 1 [Orussus abietinus]|uniref:box C/D snoRNA protein 1 n=1 Tax=Orussus abietinus TaxID=222816 RepID=UPI000626406C|nr:box C/D snoRNA protein 1 [Orussus abietinus]
MATPTVKLEKCEVCASNKAKYTCPKCEVRTCCLTCLNVHKKELECNGIRDKTKFIPLHSFTDLDLLSDYRLLEEIGRSVDKLHRDPTKRYTRQAVLPVHLHRLKVALCKRGTRLEILPQHFSRHKENTTFLNWKTRELFWRLQWIFPQAENINWSNHRVSENERLASALEKVLEPISESNIVNNEEPNVKAILFDKLQYYRAAGIGHIKVLLKAEKLERSDSRFYELDMTLTFKDNFKGKTIIEYPTLYVILWDHRNMYEIVDTDDEEVKTEEESDKVVRNKRKRKDIRSCINDRKKENPINYFFNTDFTDSETEDTNESEERNRKHSRQNLSIPDYNTLVTMKK